MSLVITPCYCQLCARRAYRRTRNSMYSAAALTKLSDAIYFDEVADVVLKGITVTVHTPNIAGIAVQSATVYFSSSNTCAFGILFYHVESVQVNLVGTHSFEHGFAMQNARNISITNISIYKNQSTWNICIKYEQCPNCQRNHGI